MDNKGSSSSLLSFYKRHLPSTCIAFNSNHGKKLFKGALDGNYLESYFNLSLQYLTQSEPAFCGLGSLCMVLNAIGIDPMRQWKASIWRWYDETMLDCCRPLELIKTSGITLPEFACLAKCNGLLTTMKRADSIEKHEFLMDIKRTSQSTSEYLVVSFSRQVLQQTGQGHFSPVGGYNEEENMVLIMDVARFKYPSYWVSFDTLWESLHPLDEMTQKSRGYCILSKGKKRALNSAFSQLALNCDSWPQLYKILFQWLPKKALSLPIDSKIEQYISLIISSIPDSYDSIVKDRLPLFLPHLGSHTANDSEDDNLKEYLKGLDELLNQVSSTRLYSLVNNSLESKKKMERMVSSNQLPLSTDTPVPMDSSSTDALTPKMASPLLQSRIHSDLALFSSLNRQSSFAANIVTTSYQVNDFIAFITIFLFSVFSLDPWYENILSPQISSEMKDILDISKLPHELLHEVNALKEQISALNNSIQAETPSN